MNTDDKTLPHAPGPLKSRQGWIALLAVAAIAVHLVLRYGFQIEGWGSDVALWTALAFGGGPLVIDLLFKAVRLEFGSDLLAGISIVTSVVLGEYLAGTLVVLMLSGGQTLEAYAVRGASSVLEALAKRMPSTANRRRGGRVEAIRLDEVAVGDELVIHPHDVSPADGEVIEGHGAMDEAYLTGEPYHISKTPGSAVISGAINGESLLVIRATKPPADSRYASIMRVMKESEQHRPRLRRLGDQLGAWYTPLAVAIAVAAWLVSGDPVRFLAVLVVATPCPLLIAIPVSIIGSISLAARRAIVIRDPAVLERAATCRTAIFDKTGTLTYGKPALTERLNAEGGDDLSLLAAVGAVERYSKHPLAGAIVEEAERLAPSTSAVEVKQVSEKPGEGMRAEIDGRRLWITSRRDFAAAYPEQAGLLPGSATGLECVIVVNDRYAATYRFRDEPRGEGRPFIKHLAERHGFEKVMLLSGDRESEVRHLAERVGITEVLAEQSPEQKVEIVRRETALAATLFVGDGLNDAPALAAATVGVAFGQNSEVTAQAAGAVVMDSRLRRIDEFLHIGRRMRRIALQSAVGGMALSVVGMGLAAMGYLPPVAGAVAQEVIDVLAVANALRAAWPARSLTDY